MTERDALSALSPGATLWILPPPSESAWSTRIDWYLGFQLRRGLPHRRFDFSSDMRQLMEAYEETLPKIPRTDESPLMIASENLLPNHQTVMIPQTATENKEWVTTCHRVWKGLGSPATRIFLPKSISRPDFEKAWPKSHSCSSEDTIELVNSI